MLSLEHSKKPTKSIKQAGHPYFGALIGRVANRISGGTFLFEGGVVDTPINEVVRHMNRVVPIP